MTGTEIKVKTTEKLRFRYTCVLVLTMGYRAILLTLVRIKFRAEFEFVINSDRLVWPLLRFAVWAHNKSPVSSQFLARWVKVPDTTNRGLRSLSCDGHL